MDCKSLIMGISLPLLIAGCATQGVDNKWINAGANLGTGVLQASLLDEDSVKQMASLAAHQYDAQNKVAANNSQYVTRLNNLTKGLTHAGDVALNFKVYISKDVNAFAMADGTVRVFSGLMDIMPDDQVLAVIQHEIGHVRLKHSYKQMKEQLLTNSAFQAVASVGGTLGELTASQLGQIAHNAVNAHFSQQDELDSDKYAVKALKGMGKDPQAMLRAIETLQKKYGSGGGFLSSHPSNEKRIDNIKQTLKSL